MTCVYDEIFNQFKFIFCIYYERIVQFDLLAHSSQFLKWHYKRGLPFPALFMWLIYLIDYYLWPPYSVHWSIMACFYTSTIMFWLFCHGCFKSGSVITTAFFFPQDCCICLSICYGSIQILERFVPVLSKCYWYFVIEFH